MANEFKQFMGLLIFGNIENLILSAQGATAHVDPFILGGLSLICVVCWLLIGTFACLTTNGQLAHHDDEAAANSQNEVNRCHVSRSAGDSERLEI